MLGICGEQRSNGTACPVVGITGNEVVIGHWLGHNLDYHRLCGLEQHNQVLALDIGSVCPTLGRDIALKGTLFHIASVEFHHGALQIVNRNGSILGNRNTITPVSGLYRIDGIGNLLHIGGCEVTYLHRVALHLVQVYQVCNGGELHGNFLSLLLGILLGLNPVRVVSVAGTESCNESQ